MMIHPRPATLAHSCPLYYDVPRWPHDHLDTSRVRTVSGNFLMSGPLSMAAPMIFTKSVVGTRGSKASAQYGTWTNAKLAGTGIR